MIKDYLQTSDLTLAAALSCYGHMTEDVIKDGPKGTFKIKNSDKVEKLVEEYFNHKMKVDPAMLAYFMKELKTRLYNVN